VCISERHDGDLGLHDEERQEALALHPQAGGQDDARFGERRRANPRSRRLSQAIKEPLPSRFPDQDGDQRRRVEDQTPSGP
jgi:hypothetical protein